jgi:hypothetical protein
MYQEVNYHLNAMMLCPPPSIQSRASRRRTLKECIVIVVSMKHSQEDYIIHLRHKRVNQAASISGIISFGFRGSNHATRRSSPPLAPTVTQTCLYGTFTLTSSLFPSHLNLPSGSISLLPNPPFRIHSPTIVRMNSTFFLKSFACGIPWSMGLIGEDLERPGLVRKLRRVCNGYESFCRSSSAEGERVPLKARSRAASMGRW